MALNEKEMLAEIERLKKALGLAEVAKTEAEEMARAIAQASPFAGGNVDEQASGNVVTVNVCLNPEVRDAKKLKWKEVELPTYFFRIDLPKGAGITLSTNGVEYYHGETYEVDIDTLRELKSRVARCWDHEKSIHGGNENEYRKPTHASLISAAARARGAH